MGDAIIITTSICVVSGGVNWPLVTPRVIGLKRTGTDW